jgi:hypothetical protein
MKIAYIILTHKNPSQVIRLIRRLEAPDVNFAIHIDREAPDSVYQPLWDAFADSGHHVFAERVPVMWGTFGIAHGIMKGIEALCRSGFDYDYAILVSGQDYPLRPHEDIVAQLEKRQGQELMECWQFPIDDWEPDGGFDRVNRHHFFIFRRRFTHPPYESGPLKSLISRVLSLFFKERREIPLGYAGYGGSTWWCLTRDAVAYMHNFLESEEGERLTQFFKTTRNTAEIMYQTILANSPFRERISDYYPWFIDWSANRSNPTILTSEWFDRLAESAESDKLFARKFDIEVDSQILDRIDRELLGYDPSK